MHSHVIPKSEFNNQGGLNGLDDRIAKSWAMIKMVLLGQSEPKLHEVQVWSKWKLHYWKDINISLNSVGSDGSCSHHLFDLNTYNMNLSMMAMHNQHTCVAEFQISGTCFSKGRISYVWITGETAICTLLLTIITSYHHVSVYCACGEKERVKYMVVPCR